MNWSDERYVRLYTRDTPDWLCLSFLAQGLFCLLLRKVDRAGVLPLGKAGRKGVGIAVGHAHQWVMLEPALDELLADGCVEIRGENLLIRNFIEAQEAEASDRARARKAREMRRSGVTAIRESPNSVTVPSHIVTLASQDVTERHDHSGMSEARDATVTPNQPSQPSQAKPFRASQPSQPGLTDDLRDFRGRLGEALGLGRPLGLGKDPEASLRVFREHLAAVPEEQLVAECLDLASRSTNGVPSSLAWFVPWLENLPLRS